MSLFFLVWPCQPGHASDNTLPQKMQGKWSLPDCKAPEEFLVSTPHLLLTITRDQVGLSTVKALLPGAGGDFYLVDTDKTRFAGKATNDGIFTIAFPDLGKRFLPSVPWESQPIGQRFEYMRCREINHPLNDIGIESVLQMEDLINTCAENDDACAPSLFAAADDNGNGALSHDELVTAMKRLIFLQVSLKQKISSEGLRLALATQGRQADIFARILMVGRDRNRSQTLDYNEIKDVFDVPPQHNSSQVFMDAAAFLKPIIMPPRGAAGHLWPHPTPLQAQASQQSP